MPLTCTETYLPHKVPMLNILNVNSSTPYGCVEILKQKRKKKRKMFKLREADEISFHENIQISTPSKRIGEKMKSTVDEPLKQKSLAVSKHVFENHKPKSSFNKSNSDQIQP
eukprot:Sdes_comp15817_c0_seq1m4890